MQISAMGGEVYLGLEPRAGRAAKGRIKLQNQPEQNIVRTMESEIEVLSAASIAPASQTNSSRWADYSSMAIDPTDDCTFWYTTEYVPTVGSNNGILESPPSVFRLVGQRLPSHLPALVPVL